jgi:UDP-glucose 4-epimerase
MMPTSNQVRPSPEGHPCADSRTIVITGVAGFIGRRVARHFTQHGWTVIGVDLVAAENAPRTDLAQYHRMQLPDGRFRELTQAARPAVCIHCAGRASVPESMADPAADFQDNAAVTFHVLETLRISAPSCRFLLLSSAAVYGEPSARPVAEAAPVSPLSAYGFHKLHCEHTCWEYARLYGLQTMAVRIFSAYGPGLRRQVIWDICQKALTSQVVRLQGTGRESRDFIHVQDIARALVLLADAAPPAEGFGVYNLASGVETRIGDLAELTLKCLGRDLPIEFDGLNPTGNPHHWQADVGRLRALGFRPQIDLAHGLAGYAQWSRAEILGW